MFNFYTKEEIDEIIDRTTDKSNYYTKGETKSLLDLTIENYYTKPEVESLVSISLKDYYTISEIDKIIDIVSDMSDYYTKPDIDSIITDLSSTVYTSKEVDQIITRLKDETYTINEVDEIVYKSEEKSYTKSEIDDLVSGISEMTNRCKGLFETATELRKNYPSASTGDWAIVGESVPGIIWKWSETESGKWVNTGKLGGNASVVIPTVTDEFGDSEKKVISQKFFTEEINNHSIKTVDISQIDELNIFPDSLGYYNIIESDVVVGNLMVSCGKDRFSHNIIQYLFGNYNVSDGILNSNNISIGNIIYRIGNPRYPNKEISETSTANWST